MRNVTREQKVQRPWVRKKAQPVLELRGVHLEQSEGGKMEQYGCRGKRVGSLRVMERHLVLILSLTSCIIYI